MDRLYDTLRIAFQETGQKVHLVGHSLGGMLAHSEAVRHPELIASVISLGSPFRGVRAHPNVILLNDIVKEMAARDSAYNVPAECFTGYCRAPSSTACAA